MKVRWKGKTGPLVLTYDRVCDTVSVEKDLYYVMDDNGEDYFYPPGLFEIVEGDADEQIFRKRLEAIPK